MPPDGEQFAIAAGAPSDPTYLFHVVEIPQPVALVSTFDRAPFGNDGMDRIEGILSDRLALVGFIGPECEGSAVVRTRKAHTSPLEVGSAAAALKVIGGWDETVPLTLNLDGKIIVVWLESFPWRVRTIRIDDEGLRTAMDLLQKAGRSFALAHVNIDWLMAFNDIYGHEAGDLLLARLHSVVRRATEKTEAQIYRRGKDDLVLLPASEPDSVIVGGERVCRAVEAQSLPLEHPEILQVRKVTVSVGIAQVYGQASCSPEDIVGVAEGALLAAKQAGRNTVRSAPCGS